MLSQINLFFRKPFYRQISKIRFVWLYMNLGGLIIHVEDRNAYYKASRRE
ncbi:hypothetical protein KsCSTR_36230 [Candidatus Kuenenia stuttgartiensis]|uniref:Uncharacterized protein n=1 Tax=Kuenenia stuttgartiensis TaxID=174633 RepID=A0A6G7GUH4_KUEST|nr:hypothetical protein KsCSTR_36230 [Candidatus Kuenenia stuttgartiensis]